MVTKSCQAHDRVYGDVAFLGKCDGRGITCPAVPVSLILTTNHYQIPADVKGSFRPALFCANVDNSFNCVLNNYYIWKHQEFKQDIESLGFIQTFSCIYLSY